MFHKAVLCLLQKQDVVRLTVGLKENYYKYVYNIFDSIKLYTVNKPQFSTVKYTDYQKESCKALLIVT